MVHSERNEGTPVSSAQFPDDLASDSSLKISDTGLNWKPGPITADPAQVVQTTGTTPVSIVGGPIRLTRPVSGFTVYIGVGNAGDDYAVYGQIVGYTDAAKAHKIIIYDTTDGNMAVAKNGSTSVTFMVGIQWIDVLAADQVNGQHGRAVCDINVF